MSSNSIGPRRTALLEAWGDHVQDSITGPGFDCSETNRTREARAAVEEFLDDPTEEQFRELWSRETLADAVIGGADPVLNAFDDIDALAERIEEISSATTYDPSWEREFLAKTAIWELYGRLHPESAPIHASDCALGLDDMGFPRPSSFEELTATWSDFEAAYDEIVGHATQGTDHEVPQNHEISEFQRFVTTNDDQEIADILQEYVDRPIVGWRNEWPAVGEIELEGHSAHVEGYAEAKSSGGLERDGPDDLWNRGYFESWKDAYREHVETVIEPNYDLTDLDPSDIEPLIDDLTESATLSTPVPAYMLGGRQGGILWSAFKKRSLEEPGAAADVLSYLFDEDEHVNLRLDRFGTFYGELNEGGGPLMSLATILLTFVYPRQYVFYKWSLVKTFFSEFSEYEIRTGFNTDQYWTLNVACKHQILEELEHDLENPTMLDVHTIIYVYNEEYADE